MLGVEVQPSKIRVLNLTFYTLNNAKMNEKKLTLKSVYELTPDEMQELDLKEWNEMALFEGDSDYMISPDWCRVEDATYFFIWSDKNLVVTSDDTMFEDELLEFCNGQDTSISRSGVNTRSEAGKWEYMEYGDDAWESFKNNKNLKIAYRGGCGYVYTLFEYKKDESEESDE